MPRASCWAVQLRLNRTTAAVLWVTLALLYVVLLLISHFYLFSFPISTFFVFHATGLFLFIFEIFFIHFVILSFYFALLFTSQSSQRLFYFVYFFYLQRQRAITAVSRVNGNLITYYFYLINCTHLSIFPDV